MSQQVIAVELTKRDVIGKGLAKVRQGGMVPAVIHDHGNESIHVMGDFIALVKAYNQAGKHHPVQLTVDGKQHLALIKDADFEPTKHILRHVVFQAIKQNETVEAEIPVVLSGEIPAERASLMVITSLDTVIVEALPKDLPDELRVDASVLVEVGDKITVADLVVPTGVTIMTDPETVISVVRMPLDQIAEADAAAAELAADAGESTSAEVETTDETAGSDAKEKE